jgi:hypothetical protein
LGRGSHGGARLFQPDAMMRSEIESIVEEIKQAVGLLRRHL